MKRAVPDRPAVGEQNAKSLRNMLMPNSLHKIPDPRPPGNVKCNAARRIMFKDQLVEGSTFVSHQTGECLTTRHTIPSVVLAPTSSMSSGVINAVTHSMLVKHKMPPKNDLQTL